MMEYKHLKLWTIPKDYFGSMWYGWYEIYGRHRDSKVLDNVNFDLILNELKKTQKDTPKEETSVTIWKANHFLVGWVETIMVHSSDEETCLKADKILEKLEDYPIYNDDIYSESLENESCAYWESMPLIEKVDICRRLGHSIFKARKGYCDLHWTIQSYIKERIE